MDLEFILQEHLGFFLAPWISILSFNANFIHAYLTGWFLIVVSYVPICLHALPRSKSHFMFLPW